MHDPAAARFRASRDPRRGLKGHVLEALRPVPIVVVVGVSGHDAGTAVADLLAPRPKAFQQLMTNMTQANTGQHMHAVAEPDDVVGPPRAEEDRSR